jgi:hypothetical protein
MLAAGQPGIFETKFSSPAKFWVIGGKLWDDNESEYG